MTGCEPTPIPQRLVTNRGVAFFFVLASFWCLYVRARHAPVVFRAHDAFWVHWVFHGALGVGLDVFIYIGFVIVVLGLFGSTHDRVEKAGIVACFANIIIMPISLLGQSYATAIWWIDLGLLFIFFLVSLAVLIRLSRLIANQTGRAGEDSEGCDRSGGV